MPYLRLRGMSTLEPHGRSRERERGREEGGREVVQPLVSAAGPMLRALLP